MKINQDILSFGDFQIYVYQESSSLAVYPIKNPTINIKRKREQHMEYGAFKLNIGGRDYVCEMLCKYGPGRIYVEKPFFRGLLDFIMGKSKREYYHSYEAHAILLIEDGVYPPFDSTATFNFDGKDITFKSRIQSISENRVTIWLTQEPSEMQLVKD